MTIGFTTGSITIDPGAKRRRWMDESPNRFAYLCHPLVIANEAGFDIKLENTVESEWLGDPSIEGLEINPPGTSHFGQGIATFHVNCLFRTGPGVQMIVTGPPNEPKDGIYPLTGIVETSWSVATFTMNWKHTRPGRVRWEEGETFCHILPAKVFEFAARDDLLVLPITDDPDLRAQYEAWAAKRNESIPSARRDLDYRRGNAPGGATAPAGEHRAHLR